MQLTREQEKWIEAAGERPRANLENSMTDVLRQKIIDAGKFIAGYYSGDSICKALSGIDFVKNVIEVELPLVFYIRWGDPNGPWFTDIGWRSQPEAVGLLPTPDKPKIFYPAQRGVRALACKAKSINVNWHITPRRLDSTTESKIRAKWTAIRESAKSRGHLLPEQCPEKLQKYFGGEKVQGGGTQYFVQRPPKMLQCSEAWLIGAPKHNPQVVFSIVLTFAQGSIR